MEPFDEIQPGMTREHKLKVQEEHAVSPAGIQVLSTPMMIRFMELNSANLIRPLLPADLASVGYEVYIRHKAPAFWARRSRYGRSWWRPMVASSSSRSESARERS